MNGTNIHDFLKTHTQTETADLLGCSQSAVSQMTRSGRDLYIEKKPDGSYSYYEIKRAKNSA
jgi:predicted transcriptional regulator